MAQRISRAKTRLSGIPLGEAGSLGTVLRVLYLVFNEGYTATSGDDLLRVDLSTEAIRVTRMLAQLLPDAAEVKSLLALMLLTDARREARTGPSGELIPPRGRRPGSPRSRPSRPIRGWWKAIASMRRVLISSSAPAIVQPRSSCSGGRRRAPPARRSAITCCCTRHGWPKASASAPRAGAPCDAGCCDPCRAGVPPPPSCRWSLRACARSRRT